MLEVVSTKCDKTSQKSLAQNISIACKLCYDYCKEGDFMSMTIKDIISSQLKQMMKVSKMSIKNLSKLSGVSMDIVSQIIKGKSLPELDNIEKLCNVFNVSVCQFFDEVINDIYIKQAIA